MAKPPRKAEFDAQTFAKELEQDAMNVLRDNLRNPDDPLAQNDAAFKLWEIANGYVPLQ